METQGCGLEKAVSGGQGQDQRQGQQLDVASSSNDSRQLLGFDPL